MCTLIVRNREERLYLSIKKLSYTISISLFFTLLIGTKVYSDEALINNDHLNVRSGPGTNYEKITQVHSEEKYPIIQQKNGWVEIELPNGSGWVISDYITIIEQKNEHNISSDENEQTKDKDKIIVSNDNTHIRSGPSTTEEIIDYVDKGTELSVLSENDEWYEVMFKDQRGYVFKTLIDKQMSFANNIRNKTIVLDAGHGGRDIGATGANGTYEKDLTYMTTNKLKRILSILGAEVLLTRADDAYVRLGSRPVLSNIHDTDAFISIHYNSFPDIPSVTGIGSYYYNDYNRSLAHSIQKRLIETTNAIDRDITFGNYLVLRQNHKPSVLLELGFISNIEKEKLLLTNEYQVQLANGITSGLANYFMTKSNH